MASIEDMYQKKTQLEHILLRPDTYIGSTELDEKKDVWVVARDPDGNPTEKMCRRSLKIVPGLYKIFDEILVNAADNKQRDFKNMTMIKVDIDRENGRISVLNDGKGIPVVMHAEHDMYVPSLIFGELLTSSNYNDDQKKVTGGRNGFGAKLTNIFSKKFTIETSDQSSGLVFRQTFENNMSLKHEPKISKAKSGAADYTRVTFEPDFEKFGMPNGLDDDIVDLMVKRVFDLAGVTHHSLQIFLNGQKLRIRNFKDYVNMYLPEGGDTPRVYEEVNDRWRICIAPSDGHFEQVSFVNSIWTMKGGAHVTSVVDQVTKFVIGELQKGTKNKGLKLKPMNVKNQLFVFVNALIENPAFDSQTKETLTTRPAKFGSKCVLEKAILTKVMKIGISDQVMSWVKFKESKDLKKNDGKKKSKLYGIPKLDDANKAGGREASKCTLILTEGDSAKALALSGLSVVGRDYFGVFPLKGKLLNVRVATHTQIMKNEEITNVKKILGLQQGKKYTDASQLRYGHLMIMADQDTDGSHIKGLVINVLHHYWPDILKLKGFVTQFITPIVRCTKKSNVQTFFTVPEYQEWRKQPGHTTGWKVKYYKGLGTSTSKEAKEYFKNIDSHRIDFDWDEDAREDDAIDMAFSKKRVDDRKTWLQSFEPGTFIDYSSGSVSYTSFVDRELILFSREDNERSIPSMIDGLKPGQRKILFSCFKRKLTGEIKVAQLAGYVSEHAAYHHGEVSLCGTIVNMAHDFVGSLNINLLLPLGQFGTRHQNGKDAASPRYIFTTLSPVTRALFPVADDALLKYLEDDGMEIEPEYYVPIIPLVLVNGAEGIGTGYSTSVPNYDPRSLISWLRMRIVDRAGECGELQPWYKGFSGDISQQADAKGHAKPGKYDVQGVIEFDPNDDSIVHITELVIKKSTEFYKEHLTSLVTSGVIRDFDALHTDTRVHFAVYLPEDHRYSEEDLMKMFKLTSSLATTNMTLFDHEGHIKSYERAEDILEEFYHVRSDLYVRRKQHLLRVLRRQVNRIGNKVRFIGHVIDETIIIRNTPKAELVARLHELRYDTLPAKDTSAEEIEEGNFDYLLSMSLLSLTREKSQEMRDEQEAKLQELAELEATSPDQMWLKELDFLVEAMEEQERIELEERATTDKLQNGGKSGKSAARRVAKKPNAKLKPKLAVTKKDMFDDDLMAVDEEGDPSPPSKSAKNKAKQKHKVVASLSSDGEGDFSITAKTSGTKTKSTAAPKTKPKPKPRTKKPVSKKPQFETDDKLLDSLYPESKASSPKPDDEGDSDDSDDDKILKSVAAMSLAQRLQQKRAKSTSNPVSKSTKKQSQPIAISGDDESDEFFPEPPARATKKKPARKQSKPIVISSDDDESGESDEFLPEAPARAKKKTSKRIDSSDDEGDESEATYERRMRKLDLKEENKSMKSVRTKAKPKPKPAQTGIKRAQKKKSSKGSLEADENLIPASTPAKNVSPMMKKRRTKTKPLSKDEPVEVFDDPFAVPSNAKTKKLLNKIPLSPHTPIAATSRARRATTAVSYKLDDDEDEEDEDDEDDDVSSISAFSDDDDDDDY